MSIKKKIQELISDPAQFIINYNTDIILNILKYCAKKYYNNESIISDDIYDLLYDIVKKELPEDSFFKKIGSLSTSKKIKLPYFMGSMNKIKPTDLNILHKWNITYKGPYCYSEKLDGVSSLFIIENKSLFLYTRGNGIEGSNISKLIKYIPSLNKYILNDNNISVRGELIISKKKFEKYENKMSNARNMISGIVNTKTIDIDTLNDIEFIAYELIYPWIINQIDQWNLLKSYGFKVVDHDININIDVDNLSKILADKKDKSNYNIDGLIISNIVLPINRKNNSNPDHAFAFKDNSLNNIATVRVNKVKWAISKDGYIKPTLDLEPTKLDNVTICSVTAYNAKYIVDNVLGEGAEILLIRSGDVIPKIIKILKKANQPDMPNINYIWSDTGVDIITLNETIEQKIKELTFFFKQIGIKNVDKGIVSKLINANLDTIYKIIHINITDLENIDGFKDKLTNKIYNNIVTRVNDMTLLDLMVASNLFGHGIGRKKLKKILDVYPNILEDDIYNITDIDGFDIKTSDNFKIGLRKFINFFKTLTKKMQKKLINSTKIIENTESNIFKDIKIVFSGFRNKEWEEIIIKNGGYIQDTISKNTTLLVLSNMDNMNTSKTKKAIELNIPIIDKNLFYIKYISNLQS